MADAAMRRCRSGRGPGPKKARFARVYTYPYSPYPVLVSTLVRSRGEWKGSAFTALATAVT
eukprot:257244-Prymnesium_polylepis.2